MYAAKSIDELYDEVKDYDLVLCNDAPLALGLNNRLDRPRVGVFAITPRQLAGDLGMDILGKPLMSDIQVVRRISEYTGYPMRFVHGEIENIKTIRRYTRDVEKYLRTYKSREIYKEFVRLPTLEKAMDAFDGQTDPYFFNKNIAVIGGELYDSLDKNFNPKPGKYDDIELFSDESYSAYSIPEFRELANDHQIAENAVELIPKENATDYAIVMDVNGKIADAVRSELYRREIPFINSLSIRDLNNIRDYIEIINRSLDFNITKVSQIRELIHTYGGFIPSKLDEYLIENYTEIVENTKALELLAIMKDVRDYTYGEVCELITGSEGAQVKLLLSQLELTDRKVNIADTADMVYSVNNFELKHNVQIPNDEKEGVLLVDSKNSVFIDRPVVIYLGMGQEWEKDLSELNLTDTRLKADELEKNVMKFQIMLQQGSRRIYICNSIKDGKAAKPCIYFQKADGDMTVYDEFPKISKCIPGPWYRFEEKDKITVGTESITEHSKDFEFSSSSFNNFFNCPRKFMYSRVTKSSDNEHKLLGSYIHEYAEFRMCFPEKAKELGQEYFVRFISDRCTPLFSTDVRGLKESKIRAAVKEIDELIESHNLTEGIRIIPKVRKYRQNEFFLLTDSPGLGSDCNEVTKSSLERHMNGTLDFIKESDIYDFKTGSAKSASKIMEAIDPNKKSDYGNDFQCLFYLSLLMDEGIENPTFTFVSTAANERNEAMGMPRDPESTLVHIALIGDKTEYLRRYGPTDTSLNRKKYIPLLDRWSEFMDVLGDIGIDAVLSDTDVSTTVVVIRMGLRPNVKKDMEMVSGALSAIAKIFSAGYNSQGNTVFVTMEAMERFRKLVADAYGLVLRYDREGFPAKPRCKCEHCEYREMCTTEPVGGEKDE